ncbi:hypothetical protein FKX85_03125 [Echinicola soli]|uniref:Uncharacterized protein n=1 Tax=Echinicola soli TaxID=2591634 RepID=A0A514CE82_9BACT|nr:hypothetical protein [Echinicola soli]QDH78080.1 hypothetical protein FKX85_03125 [Echinicola soli]
MYEFNKLYVSEYLDANGMIVERRMHNDHGVKFNPSNAFRADSVRVTFNSDKEQVYVNFSGKDWANIAPSERNILLEASYQIIDEEIYRFTFTEEDYQNAEVIEGD